VTKGCPCSTYRALRAFTRLTGTGTLERPPGGAPAPPSTLGPPKGAGGPLPTRLGLRAPPPPRKPNLPWPPASTGGARSDGAKPERPGHPSGRAANPNAGSSESAPPRTPPHLPPAPDHRAPTVGFGSRRAWSPVVKTTPSNVTRGRRGPPIKYLSWLSAQSRFSRRLFCRHRPLPPVPWPCP